MIGKRSSLALTLMICACGGDDDSQLEPGESVWSASVRELVIASEGGGLLPTPPTSECEAGSAEYSLSIARSTLDSWRCESDGTAPLRKVARMQAITPQELQAIEPSLQRLKVVDSKVCGADKPALSLRITTSAGTLEYRDSFYGCLSDPRPAIDTTALDEVFGKLTTLVIGT